MNMYQFEELKEKALATNATKEDRISLFEWCTNFLENISWNGECYDVDGIRLFPVYEEVEEDVFEIVDVEIE